MFQYCIDTTCIYVLFLATGQLVFDVLGQTEIQGVKNVTSTLSEALVQLGKQDNDVSSGRQCVV